MPELPTLRPKAIDFAASWRDRCLPALSALFQGPETARVTVDGLPLYK